MQRALSAEPGNRPSVCPDPDQPCDDLDQTLDDEVVPTWDYPHSSTSRDEDDDPSAPRVIIEFWSGPPTRPAPVVRVGDVEVSEQEDVKR
jgi:hypothetical protein